MKITLLLGLIWLPSLVFSQTYTYDQAGRIIGITYDNGSQIGYQYDDAGNISNVGTVALADGGTTATPPTTTPPAATPPASTTGSSSGGGGALSLGFLGLLLGVMLVWWRRRIRVNSQ